MSDASLPDAQTDDTPKRDCDGVVHDGMEQRTRYGAASATAEVGCQSEAQARRCDDGTWSPWSGSFTFASCSVSAGCGATPEGSSEARVRYAQERVPFGETCQAEAQTRMCMKSQWSEWSGSFTAESCEVDDAPACDGTPHDAQETRTRYFAPTAAQGEACLSEVQVRTCSTGSWSAWSGSYTHETCVAAEPSCGETPSGSSEVRTRYEREQVPYGESCKTETQTRTCSAGAFGEWSGSFAFLACEVIREACGGTPHGHAATRTRFREAQVPFGQSCVAEVQTSTCANGAFSTWTGTFTEETCSVAGPPGCGATPDGASETRTRYERELLPFGESCKSEEQSRTCNQGSFGAWSGTFEASSCSVGANPDCGDVENGTVQTRVRYAYSEAFNEPCRAETQTRACQDGLFTEWNGSFGEPSCAECDDQDGDLHGPHCTRGPDCDETNPNRYIGGRELEWNDEDENCDGELGRRLELVRKDELRELIEHRDMPYPALIADGHVMMFTRQGLEVRKLGQVGRPVALHREFANVVKDPLSVRLAKGVLVLQPYTMSGPLFVYDFSDVTRPPRELARIPVRFSERPSQQMELSLDGKRLYVQEEQVHVYDLTDPAHPKLLGDLRMPTECLNAGPLGLPLTLGDNGHTLIVACVDAAWRNSTLYAATDFDNFPTPTFQRLRQVSPVTLDRHAVARDAWWEYRPRTGAEESSQVLVELDTSVPDALVARERAKVGGLSAKDVVAAGALYIMRAEDRQTGRLCLQTSLDAAPRCSGESRAFRGSLLAEGNHALVGSPGGLSDYDVSDPTAPKLLGTWEALVPFEYRDQGPAVIRNGKAYTPTQGGLAILDLTDAREPPSVLGDGYVKYVSIGDGYAALNGYPGALIDLEDPDASQPLARLAARMDRMSIVTRGGHDYLFYQEYQDNSGAHLRWYSLEDPRHPELRGDLDLEHTELSTWADDGRYLYAGTSSSQTPSVVSVYEFDGTTLSKLRTLGRGTGSIAAHGGRVFWSESGVLKSADPSTGETTATPSALSHLLSAGSALFSQEQGGTLLAYDEVEHDLVEVQLPAGAEACLMSGAGEGYLLCESAGFLQVFRVVQ